MIQLPFCNIELKTMSNIAQRARLTYCFRENSLKENSIWYKEQQTLNINYSH